MVLMGLWLSVLVWLGYVLLMLHYTLLAALSAILLLNVVVILGILVAIARMKRNLFFPATRQQIANVTVFPGEADNV